MAVGLRAVHQPAGCTLTRRGHGGHDEAGLISSNNKVSQVLPAAALPEHGVPGAVAPSVHVTATVGAWDAGAVLKPEPSDSWAPPSGRLHSPHLPEAASRGDTGTLLCSSCAAPW